MSQSNCGKEDEFNRRTCELYKSTAKYLMFLIEEMTQSGAPISESVNTTSRELLIDLLQFTQKSVGDPSVSTSHDLPEKNKTAPKPVPAKSPLLPSPSLPSLFPEPPTIKPKFAKYMRGFWTTETFSSLMSGPWPKETVVFCRGCDKIIPFPDWDYHLKSDKEHLRFVKNNKWIKGEYIGCSLCKLVVYGGIELMRKFFKYHNDKWHLGSGKEKSVQGVPIEPSSRSSSRSDISSKADAKPPTPYQRTNSSQLQTPKIPVSMAPSSSSPELLKALRGMERLDQSEEYRFGGYCSPCGVGFTDAYDWESHLDNHRSVPSAKALECSICGFVVYGLQRDIDRTFSFDLHWDLDKQIQGEV